MNSLDAYIKVKKKDIAFICNYLEAFEGMMALRTPNPDKYSDSAVMHLMISPDYQEQFNILINGLKKDVFIEEVAE